MREIGAGETRGESTKGAESAGRSPSFTSAAARARYCLLRWCVPEPPEDPLRRTERRRRRRRRRRAVRARISGTTGCAMSLSRTPGRGDAEGGATGRDATPRGSTTTGTPCERCSATSRPTSSRRRARPDASRRAFRPRARFGVSPSRTRHGDADHRAGRSRRRSDVARTTREPSGIVLGHPDAVSAPFASSTAPRAASGRVARPRGFLGFTRP